MPAARPLRSYAGAREWPARPIAASLAGKPRLRRANRVGCDASLRCGHERNREPQLLATLGKAWLIADDRRLHDLARSWNSKQPQLLSKWKRCPRGLTERPYPDVRCPLQMTLRLGLLASALVDAWVPGEPWVRDDTALERLRTLAIEIENDA